MCTDNEAIAVLATKSPAEISIATRFREGFRMLSIVTEGITPEPRELCHLSMTSWVQSADVLILSFCLLQRIKEPK